MRYAVSLGLANFAIATTEPISAGVKRAMIRAIQPASRSVIRWNAGFG